MNILIMSRMVVRSGVGNHIKLLAEELSREGHNVFLITGRNELKIDKLAGWGGADFNEKSF